MLGAMHRFYLPPEACKGNTLTLDERESHHAADVLRVRKGESITILDGAGRELLCRVEQVHRKAVTASVQETRTSPKPSYSITLIQAVPKGKLLETIIQKATELGAARIQPLLSERVTTQLDGEGIEHKSGKWNQTAVEAIKQCGQTWLPVVEPARTLDQCLSELAQPELPLIGALQADARHPSEFFAAFRAQHGRSPCSVALWIGPEGDFSPDELARVRASGALPITLGPLVLRSDTAALYTMSVASYELSSTR